MYNIYLLALLAFGVCDTADAAAAAEDEDVFDCIVLICSSLSLSSPHSPSLLFFPLFMADGHSQISAVVLMSPLMMM